MHGEASEVAKEHGLGVLAWSISALADLSSRQIARLAALIMLEFSVQLLRFSGLAAY
jgi:hypothetical protein